LEHKVAGGINVQKSAPAMQELSQITWKEKESRVYYAGKNRERNIYLSPTKV
jgi:hypothetical protein